MAKYNKPTERDIHIDVQHFNLHKWVEQKKTLEHIRTHLNLADTSTKSLGWFLHTRNTGIKMGEYVSIFMHI